MHLHVRMPPPVALQFSQLKFGKYKNAPKMPRVKAHAMHNEFNKYKNAPKTPHLKASNPFNKYKTASKPPHLKATNEFDKQKNAPKLPRKRARDVRIEFGKFKGLMLGTLPKSYLEWLVQTGETSPASSIAEYSDLAEIVLRDPVYQDRIEWEPAFRLLSGEVKGSFFFNKEFDIMKAYREIGERYGWDMDDRDGWAKVDFDNIGTSFSGRIPRKKTGEKLDEKKENEEINKVGINVKNVKKVGGFVGEKRAERIKRMKLKRREESIKMLKNSVEVKQEVLDDVKCEDEEIEEIEEELELPMVKKGRGVGRRKKDLSEFGEVRRDVKMVGFAKRVDKAKMKGEIYNPFPGRDTLFEKAKRKES